METTGRQWPVVFFAQEKKRPTQELTVLLDKPVGAYTKL